MGEGGAVFTNNSDLNRIIESFRDWGRDCYCKPGCDNKITYNMRDLGWTVRNPGKKVITVHFHPTNFRTYHFNDDRVPGPYLLVAPSDNFTGEPCHFDIDGFNERGEPYRIQK